MLDLINLYLSLITNITGTPYLDADGQIIERLEWMYQANNIIAYSIVATQIIMVILFLIGIIWLLVSMFINIWKERR